MSLLIQMQALQSQYHWDFYSGLSEINSNPKRIVFLPFNGPYKYMIGKYIGK